MRSVPRFLVLALLLGGAAAVAHGSRGLPPGPAGRCPSSGRTQLPNDNAAAKTTLVPSGASSLLLCRYYGVNAGASSERLAASAKMGSSAAMTQLAAALDALLPPPPGIQCPLDDGSAVLAIFGYDAQPPDPVSIGLSGCLIVGNGYLVRSARSSDGMQLLQGLEALLVPRCLASQLRLSVRTQGENTTAWIGVTLRNAGAACMLSRAHGVSVTVERRGARALVRGNPLTLHPSGRMRAGGVRLLVANWSNWCGPRDALTLVVHLGAATVRTRFATLPVCLGARSPSKLLPAP
jgi:hypothetical protein